VGLGRRCTPSVSGPRSQDDTAAKAREVMAWIKHREVSEFSVRELYSANRRMFPTADDTRPVLGLLTERGWIRPLFDGPLLLNRRGVESPRFAVRPFNLWISGHHARHARHVPKGISEYLSLSHSETGRGTPPAHGAHGAHDPELSTEASESPIIPDTSAVGASSVEVDW
jgi:hypothetical protein